MPYKSSPSHFMASYYTSHTHTHHRKHKLDDPPPHVYMAGGVVFVSHHHNNCLTEHLGEKRKPKWISFTQLDSGTVGNGGRQLLAVCQCAKCVCVWVWRVEGGRCAADDLKTSRREKGGCDTRKVLIVTVKDRIQAGPCCTRWVLKQRLRVHVCPSF